MAGVREEACCRIAQASCFRDYPPSPPGVSMAVTLSQGLTAILSTAGCSDDKFRQFLIDNELVSPDSLGLLAASETALEDRVFPTLKAAGVNTDKLALMVSVKKAWHLSRCQVDKDSATASGRAHAQAPNEPLDKPTRNSLTEAWQKQHGFKFSNDRLLTEGLIGQLHRELTSSPKKLSILLAESLRLLSAIHTLSKQFTTVRDGYLGTEEVIADQVTNVLELYTRLRAFFNTVAFVTVHEPSFFGLQDVIFIEDKILCLLQMTKNDRRPPLVFFTTAWATTMQLWSDEVRTSGKTLAVLVKETASWTPPWQAWTPPATGSVSQTDYSTVPATGAGSAKERELQNELDKARKWAADMQSQRDKLRNELNGQRRRSRSRQHDDRAGGDRRGNSYKGASSKATAQGKGHKGGYRRY